RILREERPEALVKLGRDEVEPLLEADALQRPRGRRELRLRLQVRDVLYDRGAFGEELTVLEPARRNVSLRIDVDERRAGFELLSTHEVDLAQLERKVRLAERDVRGDRAAAGGVVER